MPPLVAVVLMALGFSALTAWGLSWLLERSGPVDRPRERGMHAVPTPTSGGLAIMGGVSAGMGMIAAVAPPAVFDQTIAAALALAVAYGLLGALDDLFDFGAKAKLVVQVVLALGFSALVHPNAIILSGALTLPLPVWISVAGAALWVVGVSNAVNFVDGANGLVAGAVSIVAVGLGLAANGAQYPLLALLCLVTTAACLGFLPFNFPQGRLFQGDAGALFLGGLIAAIALMGSQTGNGLSLFAAPIAVMPLLVDVFLTLIARARRRERLFHAHREHLYQRWLAAKGGDHTKLAWRVWLIVGCFTLLAVWSSAKGPGYSTAALVTSVATAVIGWLWIDRRLRRSG